jgi:hypothetical protein
VPKITSTKKLLKMLPCIKKKFEFLSVKYETYTCRQMKIEFAIMVKEILKLAKKNPYGLSMLERAA